MDTTEKTICDFAADKLIQEQKRAEKLYEKASTTEMLIRKALAPEIAKILIKFCYQDEQFAKVIAESSKDLIECIKTVAMKITPKEPALSDAEAYATAVKFYLPDAQVSVSIRIVLPNELDDDLLFLDSLDMENSERSDGQAMILDLFNTGEV